MNRATSTILALLVLVACESTTKGTGPAGSSSSGGSSGASSSGTSSSSSGATSGLCQTTCVGKAQQCGATSSDTKTTCDSLCGGAYTNDQLTCLAGKSCGEIAAANDIDELCPPGGSTSSSGGAGGACADYFDCNGTPYCTCPAGQRLGQWECISNQCVTDCTLACD